MKKLKTMKELMPEYPSTWNGAENEAQKIMNSTYHLYREVVNLRNRLEPYEQGTRDNQIIQELKKELQEYKKKEYNTTVFNFTPEEIERGCKWCSEHPCRGGAAGGNFTWKIIPTGLGIIKEIKCSCGETLDLTSDFG